MLTFWLSYPVRNDLHNTRVIARRAFNALPREQKENENFIILGKMMEFSIGNYKTRKKYGVKKIKLTDKELALLEVVVAVLVAQLALGPLRQLGGEGLVVASVVQHRLPHVSGRSDVAGERHRILAILVDVEAVDVVHERCLDVFVWAKTQIATITEKATSTRIIATNLLVKQTSSHWTIRSSLIDNSQYLSTQGLSPVIAVVDKSYSGSDFYFLSDYNVDFTVTKPSTVTSITTSIHLPDGTLARTDGSSAVIYKIVKMNNAPLSILNDFVKPGKK